MEESLKAVRKAGSQIELIGVLDKDWSCGGGFTLAETMERVEKMMITGLDVWKHQLVLPSDHNGNNDDEICDTDSTNHSIDDLEDNDDDLEEGEARVHITIFPLDFSTNANTNYCG